MYVIYICLHITCVCRYVGAKDVYVLIGDGGADWRAAIDMVCANFLWMNGLYCVGHAASKIIKKACQIPEVCMHAYIIIIVC